MYELVLIYVGQVLRRYDIGVIRDGNTFSGLRRDNSVELVLISN